MKKVNAPRCELGEGPLWRSESKEFFFIDITRGRLYAWCPATPHKAARLVFQCREPQGAALLGKNGDLVLFAGPRVLLCPYGGRQADCTLLWQLPLAPGERFNDAICDPCGRIFAGTKTETNEDGALWLLTPGQTPKRVLRGLAISNGMGFSPDNRVFYHTDSGLRTIFSYQYDPNTATMTTARPVVRLISPDGAVPDGMTVDAAGNLWVACWGGGCVQQFSATGKPLRTFALPAVQISSVAFGGTELCDLLVTSAATGLSGIQDGGIFLLSPGASGRAEFRARL